MNMFVEYAYMKLYGTKTQKNPKKIKFCAVLRCYQFCRVTDFAAHWYRHFHVQRVIRLILDSRPRSINLEIGLDLEIGFFLKSAFSRPMKYAISLKYAISWKYGIYGVCLAYFNEL